VIVEAAAPCRADLAGGTLDIWPLGVLHPGSLTVNVAIGVGVRLLIDDGAERGEVLVSADGGAWRRASGDDPRDLVAVVVSNVRPRGGVRVTVLDQPPIGSGLGGSSTFAVALAAGVVALDGGDADDGTRVRTLRDLEARVLQAPTGTQDHWAAVRGGTLAVWLDPGGERIEALDVDPQWVSGRLTVFFTGIVHHSGMVNWQVIRRRMEGHPTTTAALEEIAVAARSCRAALLARDAAGVAEAVAGDWAARRRLAPEVSPPELERLTAVALGAGSDAVKACGAGGGGSLLLWHAPGARGSIVDALLEAAPEGRPLPCGAAVPGCRVRRVDDPSG
jgi:D-glycero-alpha-D-manno-heptose-7-phosphate kinase